MSTNLTPAMGPIKIIFLDIPAGVAVDEVTSISTTFHDFLRLLSRMSGSVSEQIKGLGKYQLGQKGFDLSDGCWWYRIVKLASTQAQEADSTLPRNIKGDWCRLATLFAYDYMRANELASGLPSEEGWIEVQHDLQKKRDESTASKAQQHDNDWRSSISHTQASPQDDDATFQLGSGSTSDTNTDNTSPRADGQHAVKPGVASHGDTESDSMGSCSSTEQVKQLLEDYQAQAHPLAIEWPRPPRCTLIHFNEDNVTEDAESRNHHPVSFPKFAQGEEYTEGLPSYTPRPGPFPAQIGRPPSEAHCAYEIRNDIDYHPESPSFEDARMSVPAISQTSASHEARYNNGRPLQNIAPHSQAPVLKVAPLQTSMSSPGYSMQYDPATTPSEPHPYPTQSTPAHMQGFQQPPWPGTTGVGDTQRLDRGSFSQEGHRPQAFGYPTCQGTGYVGSASYSSDGQPYRDTHESQTMFRSSSSPLRLYQSSMAPLSSYPNQPDIRYPSCPPPPQEVVPKNTPPGQSSFQYGGRGSGIFSHAPFQVNIDAAKESENLDMRAQSQQHYASYQLSPRPSHQPTPNSYSRSNSATQQRTGFTPPSRIASQRSNRMLLPGFGARYQVTEAPTFAIANNFGQSFDMMPRGLDPNSNHPFPAFNSLPSASQGHVPSTKTPRVGCDPALEVNQHHSRANVQAAARTSRIFSLSSEGPPQPQFQQSYHYPRHGTKPWSGQFSPPKPRMKGKRAVNVLGRYNHGGLTQSRAPNLPTMSQPLDPRSSEPPSLLNEVSQGLSMEYQQPQGVLPAHQKLPSQHTNSSDQMSSSPSPKSSASNFSDDFNRNGPSRKKAKSKRKNTKRGGAKKTSAVKKEESEDENAKKEQDLHNARSPGAEMRSSGQVEPEAVVEGDAMMSEG